MPFYTQVEYVEVYGYDAESSSPNNPSFNLHFRDEFDSIDEERWGKGKDKTWGNTGSTIKPANTYVEDGHLVLKVDKLANYKEDEGSTKEESDKESEEEEDKEGDKEEDKESDKESDKEDK